MKANELMIGDLLKWKEQPGFNDEDRNMVLRVKNIFDDAIKIDGRFGLYHISLFEPIPLTAEILEKNGFEDIGDDIYQLEEKPCWFWVDFFNHTYGCEYDTSTYEYEDDEHRLKLYGIPSIHELQHALRLCGIEKEIVL